MTSFLLMETAEAKNFVRLAHYLGSAVFSMVLYTVHGTIHIVVQSTQWYDPSKVLIILWYTGHDTHHSVAHNPWYSPLHGMVHTPWWCGIHSAVRKS